MSYTTPNMNLLGITIGTDSGLTIENNYNANVSVMDNHNHTSGNGVQIPPAGLNINTALAFQNNPATGLQATVFTPQSSLTTLNALYVSGVDLYFNDGSGDAAIQITKGGSVFSSSSGISSGSATASFVSGVLVVNSASNTPANIQGGSLLLGNTTASSKFLTLNPPAAMAANYSLTLPSIPGSISFMTLDTSGNMAGGPAVAGGITGSNIAAGTITRSNIAAVGQQISANSGAFVTASTNFVAVTNLSVSITTSGSPVILMLIGTGTTGGISGSHYTGGGGGSFTGTIFTLNFLSGSTVISSNRISVGDSVSGTNTSDIVIPASSFQHFDTPAAGTYTYSVQVACTQAASVAVAQVKLVAYELF